MTRRHKKKEQAPKSLLPQAVENEKISDPLPLPPQEAYQILLRLAQCTHHDDRPRESRRFRLYFELARALSFKFAPGEAPRTPGPAQTGECCRPQYSS